jgi:hypothetical protein
VSCFMFFQLLSTFKRIEEGEESSRQKGKRGRETAFSLDTYLDTSFLTNKERKKVSLNHAHLYVRSNLMQEKNPGALVGGFTLLYMSRGFCSRLFFVMRNGH